MKNYKLSLASLLCLFGVGCLNDEKPYSIDIDEKFTPEQVVAIKESLHETCKAVKFCPFIVENNEFEADGKIVASFDYEKYNRPKKNGYSSLAFQSEKNVYVDMNSEAMINFDYNSFRVIFTHEFLHMGIKTHSETGIMRSQIDTFTAPYCIDKDAADKWCKKNDQTGCISTCN